MQSVVVVAFVFFVVLLISVGLIMAKNVAVNRGEIGCGGTLLPKTPTNNPTPHPNPRTFLPKPILLIQALNTTPIGIDQGCEIIPKSI